MSHQHYCLDCEFRAVGQDVQAVEDHQEQTGHTIESVKDTEPVDIILAWLEQLPEGAEIVPEGFCYRCGLLMPASWEAIKSDVSVSGWHLPGQPECRKRAAPVDPGEYVSDQLWDALREMWPFPVMPSRHDLLWQRVVDRVTGHLQVFPR